MAAAVRVAVDAMGGDYGPSVTVPAALESLARDDRLEIVLVGREGDIRRCIVGDPPPRLTIRHCDEVVAMDDRPSAVLRAKRTTSMRAALELLQSGEAAACVSAGNTGALMALGSYLLQTSAGIDRPAICTPIPVLNGHCYLLDLGANVDSSSEHLHQFALMGSVLASVLDSNPSPRVALLNIGVEETKGNEKVKLAATLIGDDVRLNYIGYIEADRMFEGGADVVVCDGFVGNIALKASEGTARLIVARGTDAFRRNWLTRLIGLLALPAARRVRDSIDPQAYNGAVLLGLQGVVVKSHGHAQVNGYTRAIETARLAVDRDMVSLLDRKLESLAI